MYPRNTTCLELVFNRFETAIAWSFLSKSSLKEMENTLRYLHFSSESLCYDTVNHKSIWYHFCCSVLESMKVHRKLIDSKLSLHLIKATWPW